MPAPVAGAGVVTADLAPEQFAVTFQQLGFLHGMKQGIEGSRTYSITVLRKFFNKPKAIDWSLGSMMKNMQFNEARKQILVRARRAFRFAQIPIPFLDIIGSSP